MKKLFTLVLSLFFLFSLNVFSEREKEGLTQ